MSRQPDVKRVTWRQFRSWCCSGFHYRGVGPQLCKCHGNDGKHVTDISLPKCNRDRCPRWAEFADVRDAKRVKKAVASILRDCGACALARHLESAIGDKTTGEGSNDGA